MISTFSCVSECLLFSFVVGVEFFYFNRLAPGVHPRKKKKFPKKTKAARTDAGFLPQILDHYFKCWIPASNAGSLLHMLDPYLKCRSGLERLRH